MSVCLCENYGCKSNDLGQQIQYPLNIIIFYLMEHHKISLLEIVHKVNEFIISKPWIALHNTY